MTKQEKSSRKRMVSRWRSRQKNTRRSALIKAMQRRKINQRLAGEVHHSPTTESRLKSFFRNMMNRRQKRAITRRTSA